MMDHAGYWETSTLMYLRPDLLDLERIKNEDLTNEEGQGCRYIGPLPAYRRGAQVGRIVRKPGCRQHRLESAGTSDGIEEVGRPLQPNSSSRVNFRFTSHRLIR